MHATTSNELSAPLRKNRRRRLDSSARIPNEELRWWVCSSAAALGERGGYSDGFSTHGEPDPLPYTAKELGAFESHGDRGIIGRARECSRVWRAIGQQHREVLAMYYNTREPGGADEFRTESVDSALYKSRVEAVVTSMRAPAEIVRLRGMKTELLGVAVLLRARGINSGLVAATHEAIRVAHNVWEIERDQVEQTSTVKWKTGVLYENRGAL